MLLQVARTINNMQQQIQQHQRQLAQALLMKQQQQPPTHSGLHPGGAKSTLDSFPGHPQTPGLPDLQTKEPQSSPNTYSPYTLCEWDWLYSVNINVMILNCIFGYIFLFVFSWTESKHECNGGGRFVNEGTTSTAVTPVTVDTPQLHRKPLWKRFSS